MAKPDVDTTTLVGMDRALSDFGGSLEVVVRGVRAMRAMFEQDMPDEGGLHERLAGLAGYMSGVATLAEEIRMAQRMANGEDWRRILEPRKNERGYDYGTNQE
ncbi:hypothetical protein H4696_008464 [Amycolatopsis lexingtonensis]|uniref:ESX-1 secretion-associated protein n=1 Tax=Amycolatopsis lexingtonensis TaxID=218822 RepID=A0ABR9IDW9_9PSEU|nr:hypothetical protein [Amycolatopsis lexingtonensis]MBE1501364.1 hypothetical protein [Amycolatopsis lexingtonensis]